MLATAALMVAAMGAGAQVTTSAPIRVKVKAPKQEVLKYRGEVIRADGEQIIVRSQKDERMVRTFSYSPKAREQMEKILERGGYQYGDRIEVRYRAGSDVALAIKGKPSKPL